MIRYAIWTAVSTRQQATADKVSLGEQERLCRERANAKGWRESVPPFIVEGESRTNYINLRDAEANIKPLRDCLNSAQNKEYDVLVLYDFTRLRELLDPVSRTLSAYGIQLYSINQPIEPLDPEIFSDEGADTASILQNFSGMASRAEISALRRRFKLGMPKRVTLKGLHPFGSLPYGYRKMPGREHDRAAPPVPDPITASYVIQAKEMLLAGKSLSQICAALDEIKAPVPRGKHAWQTDSLRRILRNPFYSGTVSFGKYKRVRDPRTGTVKIDRSGDPRRMVTAKGVHTPLWDESTRRQIEAEFSRRGRASRGKKTQRFSRMLYCPVCGTMLWVGYTVWGDKPTDDTRRAYYCPVSRKHFKAFEKDIKPKIAAAVAEALKNYELIPEQDGNKAEMLRAALVDLQARRDRITDAYSEGAMTLEEYTRRTETIDTQLRQSGAELVGEENRRANSADRAAALESAASMGEEIQQFILNADPQAVNTQLRMLLRSVVIDGGEVKFEWN